MKTVKSTGKVERTRRRADFLFNDGQFRARAERNERMYRRQDKYKNSWLEYNDRFYQDIGQAEA